MPSITPMSLTYFTELRHLVNPLAAPNQHIPTCDSRRSAIAKISGLNARARYRIDRISNGDASYSITVVGGQIALFCVAPPDLTTLFAATRLPAEVIIKINNNHFLRVKAGR